MEQLFSQLNRLAVSDGWIKVSSECGTVAAKFTAGRLTAFSYKTYRKQ